MSIEAVSWALRQTAGSPGTKTLLIALANYADAKGRAWPSQRHLAKILECSVRTIRTQLDRLEDSGFVERESRWRQDGGRHSDVFTLALNVMTSPKGNFNSVDILDTEPDFFDPDELWGGAEKTEQNQIPAKSAGGSKPQKSAYRQNLPPPPAKSAGAPRHRLPVPLKEDTVVIDTSLRSVSIVASSEITLAMMAVWDADLDLAFDWFWHNFPKTRRRDKIKCKTKFARIVSGKHKTLNADASQFVVGAVHYREGIKPKFARMPITWINNGNFLSEENYGIDIGTTKPVTTEHDQRGAVHRALADELEDERTASSGDYATEARRRSSGS